jgi:hypothetical protein
MKLYSKHQVIEILKDSNELTPHALILFYVLSANKSSPQPGNTVGTIFYQIIAYGPDILEKCDVIKLVSFLQVNRNRIGRLYSQLLSLIVDQLQHIFHLRILLTNLT